MPVVNRIGHRDKFLIPTIAACLLAANEQNRRPSGIEGVEHPILTSLVLNLSSRMWVCRDVSIPTNEAFESVGPTSYSKLTMKSTLCWS